MIHRTMNRQKAPEIPKYLLLIILMALPFLFLGCQTTESNISSANSVPFNAITLAEGDVLEFSFPGDPNLNTTQQIRRDGALSLPLVGEIQVAGKTPDALKQELTHRYASELQTSEVIINLKSSNFINVTGAVLKPGKILLNRPITVLEAVMEAGGFKESQAKTKGVIVIRHENGNRNQFIINLDKVLKGENSTPFYLKPYDNVIVPFKSWRSPSTGTQSPALESVL